MNARRCSDCGGQCRVGAGSCTWDYTSWCRQSLTKLRSDDSDAFFFLRRLRLLSEGAGIQGHHRFPLQKTQGYDVGELKATGTKDGERCLYRLYYGQPDTPADLVVGLNLNEKKIHSSDSATRTGQDADITRATDGFRSWLKLRDKDLAATKAKRHREQQES